MALVIQTTGLEEYAPGGNARVKVLVIGGPGAGKTRWASTFPKPIYADCEKGLASVADRKVPFASIKSSQDMLDLLAMMKQECRQPPANRKYETFIVDTLDAFMRKVKNEWMELNKKEVFTGWEAWGYLNSKMQLLMTRLLNLDMNVIVNVHYKDKTTKDDETGKESHTLMLQLQGELADTAFNDFDLVGWMGTYWEVENGERIQKRGLTFKATPDKPFLKDRLHVTPKWLEVSFEPTDYSNLFDAIQSRVEEMEAGEVLDVVPPTTAELSSFVIPVGAVGSGPMPAIAPKDLPLAQMDKPTLMKKARDAGVTTTVDGSPIKGNTLKSELIAALEAFQNATPAATAPETPIAPTESKAAESPAPAPSEPVIQEAAPPVQPDVTGSDLPAQALARVASPRRTTQVAEGTVDTTTGELIEPPVTHEKAVETVKEVLNGEVIDDQATPTPAPTPEPAPAAAAPVAGTCDDCGKSLEGENPDFLKLSHIKYRKKLCADDYQKRKTSR